METVDQVVAWARRAPAMATDAAVAAAVAWPTVMDAWWNEDGSRQADARTYALAVVSITALLVRRRWPIPVAVVCGGALTGWYVLGHHGELLNLPMLVALYTVAVQGDRRTTLVTALVACTWSGILGFTSDDPIGARGGSPVLETITPLVPLGFGEATRLRRELVARTAAEREREAARRVEAERVRIAQEFHDLVAHTMAAVNVQMGLAVAAFESNPDTARAALAQARASSKEALQELRATVALLRDARGPGEPGAAVPAPAPRLAQLDGLAEPARSAGIAVTVAAEIGGTVEMGEAAEKGEAGGPGVPAAVELAAYRIVQEALTNVIRHSDARNVAVSVRREGDRLVVEVTDDGTTAGGNGAATVPAGYGLVGMAERAAAVGGRVEHGPVAGGGFRVRAVLPLVPAQGGRP